MGKVLVGRVCCPPFLMVSVMTVLEDEEGNGVFVAIYNLPSLQNGLTKQAVFWCSKHGVGSLPFPGTKDFPPHGGRRFLALFLFKRHGNVFLAPYHWTTSPADAAVTPECEMARRGPFWNFSGTRPRRRPKRFQRNA